MSGDPRGHQSPTRSVIKPVPKSLLESLKEKSNENVAEANSKTKIFLWITKLKLCMFFS